MTRGILLTGNESTLLSAAAAEAFRRVESFALAVIPNRFPLPEGVLPQKIKTGDKTIVLPWNPASPISARSLLLAAENRMGKINDAVLICSPPAVFKTIKTLTPEEIDILVNDHIKGWFFIIRELCLYFRRTGSGSLSLVVPELSDAGKSAQTDILGPSAAASFRSFANGILAAASDEPFQLMGFTGSEAGKEGEFASWLFKIIDEGEKKNSGRWHRYAKLRLF